MRNNVSGSSKRSKQATHQKQSSSEVIAKTLLDLCNNNQLTIHQVKQDQKDALNSLIKVCDNTFCIKIYLLLLCKILQQSIHGLTKEEQFDKAAQATVNRQ